MRGESNKRFHPKFRLAEFINDLAAHLLKEIGFDYANQDAPEA